MKRAFFWFPWIGLIMVTVISVLVLAQLLLPTRAVAGESSDGLAGLIPDIGKIYREAVYTPLESVEAEITDPDIHNFYLKYLENAGLKR